MVMVMAAAGGVNMASDEPDKSVPYVKCPCKEIGSIGAIRSALDSTERTNAVVAWLSGTNKGHWQLSCQSRANVDCTRRVSASFSILNGIRDAVRPFLETAKPSEAAEPTYEDSFPSLASNTSTRTATTPNVLVARKKTKKKVALTSIPPVKNDSIKPPKKEKRRVRPEPAQMKERSKGNIAMLSSTAPIVQRDNNLSQVNKWPAITVNSKSRASKQPKRRINPVPATPWGPANGKGNIAALPSSDQMPPVTREDFEKQKATWPVKKVDEKKVELTTIMPESRPIAPENGVHNERSTNAQPDQMSESSREEQLRNLGTVYAALILNQLVPSTALELHLLIRLLTAKEDSLASLTTLVDTNGASFQILFTSLNSCRSFAIHVLTQVKCIMRNLPSDMIEGFVNCPPFASMLPELTNELSDIVQRRKELSPSTEVETVSIVGSTHPQVPMIALPFDPDRDSRNNYKSRDELAIYKNREESRDAFLYQLRAFQNTRGKMLDVTQAERSIDRIRTASRTVIQGLLKTNMHWFAQFFCELLVQIGLVPMEETDKELLNITNKDKLQKLHKRFSAKGSQTSKSTKNLVLDPSKSAGTASPATEAQQHFPGHQEFFFIFILSTDCYSFSVHLKNRLKAEITKLASSLDTKKGVEKRMLHLMLLSRFLGLLIFSPSWHESGIVGGARYDLLSEFNPELDVFGMVERAYTDQQLVVTVPWVVEFLRMARWSPTLQRSDDFERLLGLVLAIRRRVHLQETNTSTASLATNMQLVSFYFETLFGDVVGLERIAKIPATELAEARTHDGTTQPDDLPLPLSNTVLFTCYPHAEELVTLLASHWQSTMKTAGSSRKLTPYSVGASFGSSTDHLGSNNVASLSPVKPKRRDSFESASGSHTPVGGTDEHSPIIGKLVEAFFHQHRELKEICEFLVDHALKNASSRLRNECVVPLLKDEMEEGANQSPNSLHKKQVVDSSRAFLSKVLGSTIPAALESLCPPTVQPKVRDIASKLTVSHAIRLGDATIDSLVHLELKKLTLERARRLKKQASASEDTSEEMSSSETESQQYSAVKLEDALVRLRNGLSGRLWERRPDDMKVVAETVKGKLYGSGKGGTTLLLGLSRAFEMYSVQLLTWCLDVNGCPSNIRWCIAASYLGILAAFAGTRDASSEMPFAAKVTPFFSNQEPVDDLIEVGLDGAEDIETVAHVLLSLARAGLIPVTILEMSLIDSFHKSDDRGQALCHLVVSNVDGYCNGLNARAETDSTVFGRLRDELSRDSMQSS